MLVLTRKAGQTIVIGDGIEVTVLSIAGEKVRLGVRAPRDVPVFREEVVSRDGDSPGRQADRAGEHPASP